MNEKGIKKIHNLAVLIITVACIGAVVESITQGWEYWVPPLIIAGVIAAWVLHLTEYKDVTFRENYYLIFSMLVAFYHGIHPTSFFDIIVISSLGMVVVTMLGRIHFLTFFLSEFFVLFAIQLVYALMSHSIPMDSLGISRIILHVIAEICIYRALLECIRQNALIHEELSGKEKDEATEREGMEDFLVNISHELRTPVNVINGMTTLMLKKEITEDVLSIRDAGGRLSRQIEDIQDYSEIQRGDVVLEEDKYTITSLLNDIAMFFVATARNNSPELIIDLDPNVPAMMRGDLGKIHRILSHLLDNAFKFTRSGGVYLKVYGTRRDYGINLVMEVTDTGAGMSETDIEKISKGRFQAGKKRNRSTGGIGLGLSIVYGFVRLMNGFVSIESKKRKGTTVRVSLVQEVVDPTPCLSVDADRFFNIIFHAMPEKYKVTEVREFYRKMATNMAEGLRVNLYAAQNLKEVKRLLERGDITHIFMGAEEYRVDPGFFDALAEQDTIVAISAPAGFSVSIGSKAVVMPKPLYGYPVAKILNGETERFAYTDPNADHRPVLDGLRALIVDDEPMNLVVASGLFRDYNMVIDTAESGREALYKYDRNDYDVVFMDHMMPEMDGVEAMKKLRFLAEQNRKVVKIVALTANAISGAREMFLREGFDGFISKPIHIAEFERVMNRIFPRAEQMQEGGRP
ncbi:MAG: response regulator [Lachnospiraceae bacterium]|nr:response regulator [Lachnospiraceae bacterium]